MNLAIVNAPHILIFDVNETLLDLAEVNESVDKVLLEKNSSKLWFSKVLHYSLVMTVSGQFRPFPEIGAAVLQMMASERDVILSADAAFNAIAPIRRAPAHPDVLPALSTLQRSGVRMATLSNSTYDGLRVQLECAGIASFFEQQLSVESIGKYKPHRDVYQSAATQMEARPEDCMLVAAHPWDVAGAAWAGMRTAFITRLGCTPFPIGPSIEIEAKDMGDFVKKLGISG